MLALLLFLGLFFLAYRFVQNAGMSGAWAIGIALVFAFVVSSLVAQLLGALSIPNCGTGIIATILTIVVISVVFVAGFLVGRKVSGDDSFRPW